MKRTTIAAIFGGCLAATVALLLSPAAHASMGRPASITMTSGLNATRATIPVSMNGEHVRCVLDTGSSAILVSAGVARSARLSIEGSTYEVSPDGHTYADHQTHIARFAVGGYSFRNIPALVSSNLTGNDALCGYDFFARIPTLIDRERRLVTLFPSDAVLDRMRCLAIDLTPHVPLATVEINGAWIDSIVLDSGMVGGGALWDGVRPQLRRPLIARADYETNLSAVRTGLACGSYASVRFASGTARNSMPICTEPQRPDGYNGIIETNLPTIRAMGVDYIRHRICFTIGGFSSFVSSSRPATVDADAWSRFSRLRPPH